MNPATVHVAAGSLMANGTWDSVRIDPAGADRMSGMVYDAGLSLRSATYADLVDESLLPTPVTR